MPQKPHITIRIYDAAKVLLETGASYKEVSDFMKISVSTVSRIANSKDYDEYRNNVNAYYFMQKKKAQEKAAKEKQPEKKAEPKLEAQAAPIVQDIKLQGGTLSASYQFNRLYDVLKSMDETMKVISNKLAAIVDELID